MTRQKEHDAEGGSGYFDPLAAVTLLAGLYFFQIWGFASADTGSALGGLVPLIAPALMVASLAMVVLPRLDVLLIVNAAAFCGYYVANAPVASNNQLTAFALCLVILAARASVATRSQANFRAALFTAIAGPGRWILPGMYFFGIYHKINADFLDPSVSCAVELYRIVADHVALAEFRPGHYFAIYITFIAEAIAMVALFVPGWKRYGLLIGVPFHIIIGLTGYAYYKDFSTIVLVLYALFLTPATFRVGYAAFVSRFGDAPRAMRVGRLMLLALALIVGASALASRGLVPTHNGFLIPFAVYAIAFYLAAILYFREGRISGEGNAKPVWPKWMLIIPALYFLNGWSPYLGLRTEASIAMFSNLHTEAARTNHLIHGQLPFAALYQNDVVEVISSDPPWLQAAFGGPGKALVRYEFDRILAQNPNFTATFRHNGQVRDTSDWTNSFLEHGPLMRAYLLFKPIDFARPKVCTH
ncbi:MAG: hypothetical protein GKR99_08265 [Rhodobacteraceae bacterium]|nr:hypothetical protein [Paracoccaceae bacterium]